jgi:hypothetical protein
VQLIGRSACKRRQLTPGHLPYRDGIRVPYPPSHPHAARLG